MSEPASIPQLPDYHMHTPLCRHACGMPAEYRRAAAGLKLPEICFTDHAPAPDGYDPENRMLIAEYPEYRRLLDEQAPDPALPDVLHGLEADYYPGSPAWLRTWLPDGDFDLVLGSVHYIDGWEFDDPDQVQLWNSVDVAGVWRRYFELLGAWADEALCDVIAHLDLPKKFGYRPPDRLVREMACPILDRIKKAGLAVEINTAGLRKPVREIYPAPLLLTLACEREIPICFGSDAHAPAEVGHAFDAALQLARQAGYKSAVRFACRRMTAYSLEYGT